ncbi:hypothetical protein PINS_up005698 [Pythium insidiosum]|nr:hypothetical protein PINS_up005698 [Pythium insidiosum]
MKQENQVLLKKLHDVVARYRQLQQQYQSLVEQQAAQATDGSGTTNGSVASTVSDELSKEHDQAVKKLEAEKHELIEKLKQVVGTCRVMQKQLQEAKEENEALKSPAKPMLSANNVESEDNGGQIDSLQRRISTLEQDLADKEVERQELVGKMKEVISRYQSLQMQLEEKMGEHDAAVSKVAALELELRTRQSNEDIIKERERDLAKMTTKVEELTLSFAQEEARTAVLREENVRIKEQLTAILDDKRRSDAEQQHALDELQRENASLEQKVQDLEQTLEIMRKQQDDAEQMYVEVASKLNQTLRDNGELHGRVESLNETIEILERQVTDSNALHKIEVRRLQDEKEVAITGEGSSDPADIHELQRRLIQLEREMEMIGIGSEYLSLAEFAAFKDDALVSVQERLADTIHELEIAHSQVDHLSQQNQELIDRLNNQISSAGLKSRDEELDQAQTLEEAQSLAQRRAEEIAELTNQLATITAERDVLAARTQNQADEMITPEITLDRHTIALTKVRLALGAAEELAAERAARLAEEISELTCQLASVVAERDELAARSAEWDEQRASMGAAEELAAQRQERLERLEDEILHLQDEIRARDEECREINNQISQLNAEQVATLASLSRTVGELEGVRAQLDSVEAENHALKQHRDELVRTHESRLAELQGHVNVLEDRVLTLQATEDDLKSTVARLTGELEALSSDSELRLEESRSHEAKIESLESLLEERDQELSAALDELHRAKIMSDDLQKTLSDSCSQEEAYQSQVEDLQKKLESASRDIESVNEQMESKMADHDLRVIELQKQWSEEKAARESELIKLQNDLRATAEQLVELERKSAEIKITLSSELGKVREECEQLQNRLNESSALLQDKEEELKLATEKLELLESQHDETTRDLREQIHELNQQVEISNHQAIAAAREVDDMKSSLVSLLENNDIDNDCGDSHEMILSLQSHLARSKNAREEYEEECRELRSKLDSVLTELAGAQSRISAYRSRG